MSILFYVQKLILQELDSERDCVVAQRQRKEANTSGKDWVSLH